MLAFVSKMPLLYGEDAAPASSYVCPMHPEVTATEPATCPICGMKLVAGGRAYACPMHPEVTAAEPATCPICGMKLVPPMPPPRPRRRARPARRTAPHDHGASDGLEWEDLMPEINRASDPGNMIWQLIDRETGAVNGAIELGVHRRGPGEDPAGQRDGPGPPDAPPVPRPRRRPVPRPVARRVAGGQPGVEGHRAAARPGETVDILLDVSNPGLWMAHCHIAEHTESGMMFSFNVARRPEPAR